MRRAVGLLLAFVSATAVADELTLRQAVAAALERNPQIRIANAREQQSAAALNETRAMWLPHVDVSETVISSNNPVFVFGSLLEQGRFGSENFDPRFLNSPNTLNNYRLGLNVRFTVFDQFRRVEATRQASNGVAQSKAGSDEAAQSIRLEVISKFYGLLLAQERRAVAADAVRTAASDASMMRDKFRQGLLVESDALAAEVQMASFRQQEIEAEGEIAIAKTALNSVIGRDALADTTVNGLMPERRVEQQPVSTFLSRALVTRGDVGASRLASENARLQLQVARGSLLPRVDTFASWGASGPAFGNRNGDHSIGAVASLDIFDGGKLARVAQAQSSVEQARATEAAARSKVEMEIISAWQHVRSADQKITVAQAAVKQAETAARIVRDRYEQGLTTITEHLRAQTALTSTRLNLLAARYDYLVGSADLARSTGGLHDVALFE